MQTTAAATRHTGPKSLRTKRWSLSELGLWAVSMLYCIACTTNEPGGKDTGGSAGGGTTGTSGRGGGGEATSAAGRTGGDSGRSGGAGAATGGRPSGGGENAGGAGSSGLDSHTGSTTGSAGAGSAQVVSAGAGGAAGSAGLTNGAMGGAGTDRAGAGGGDGKVADGGTGSSVTGTDGALGGAVADTVARTSSTFTFQHFPIQTTNDGVWNGSSTPGKQTTSTKYDTVVLENGYLRVTLLPSYGGRILSIVHKPSNRELLYQNPIGTPYLMLEGIFYYDYLVIMGGIFPSFPEPEHGKYWCQPYDLKVVSESKDAITVRMSRQDDLEVAKGVPSKYDVGRTDVLVELDVTLRAGSTSLELGTKLTNTKNKAISKFEYWTNTTLAPGSTPGNTAIPLNTRIMASMEKVHLQESDWSWFANAEERISGEIFKWNNLSYFKNWVDQGIGYASPDYRANWSGMINYENTMGIVRASDNAKTPGLKLWTFGRDSIKTDINDSTQWLRPAIEMWHGVTAEFWTRGTMSANEVRQWTDNYFPTFGLKEITSASPYGAMYLSSSKTGTDTVLSVAATLTLPNQTVKAILRVGDATVAEQDVVVAAADATTVSATVATSKLSAGAAFQAEFLQGDKSLLSGKISLP